MISNKTSMGKEESGLWECYCHCPCSTDYAYSHSDYINHAWWHEKARELWDKKKEDGPGEMEGKQNKKYVPSH